MPAVCGISDARLAVRVLTMVRVLMTLRMVRVLATMKLLVVVVRTVMKIVTVTMMIYYFLTGAALVGQPMP